MCPQAVNREDDRQRMMDDIGWMVNYLSLWVGFMFAVHYM